MTMQADSRGFEGVVAKLERRSCSIETNRVRVGTFEFVLRFVRSDHYLSLLSNHTQSAFIKGTIPVPNIIYRSWVGGD